jgi:superfamily II DNA or RNA helicase
MLTLRPYQNNLLNEAITCSKSHQRIVVQLPTGGGKSPIQARLALRYLVNIGIASGKSVALLVDRGKLLSQMAETMQKWGLNDISIINDKVKNPKPAQLYIVMVRTLQRRIDKPYFTHLMNNVGMVIVDEAHMGDFTKSLTHPTFANTLTYGFTATPIFASNKFPMNKLYQTIVVGKQVGELIAEGNLVQNYTLASKLAITLDQLSVKNGRIDDEQQGTLLSKQIYVTEVVNQYEHWALGKKAMVYNANKSHNKIVCEEFRARGYECVSVDDDTPENEREKVLEWYEAKPNAILCNVGLYTKGFDEPTIECIIQNKKTLSLPLYLQMVGRGGRPCIFPDGRKKVAFINIDMHRNIDTHGDWNWDRDWKQIFYGAKVKKDGVAPVKTCPKCECIVPASTRECNGLFLGGGLSLFDPEPCGYIWEKTEAEIREEIAVQLQLETKNVSIDTLISSNQFGHLSGWQIAKQLVKDTARIGVGAFFICPDGIGYAQIYNECVAKVKEYRTKGGQVKVNDYMKDLIRTEVISAIKSKFPQFEI